MRSLITVFASVALTAVAAAQPGQTVFTIVDTGDPAQGYVRVIDAWTLLPAPATPVRTTLTLQGSVPASAVTAIATIGFPDTQSAESAFQALVVLGTPSLGAGPDAEVHVFRYTPGASVLVPVTTNIKLAGAAEVKDLHRTDTGCILALGEDNANNPSVFRLSVTPNGTSVSSLVVPLSGVPTGVNDWTSIGTYPDGRLLVGGQINLIPPYLSRAWSVPTQGGAMTQVLSGPIDVLAVGADGGAPPIVHIGGTPNLPANSTNVVCGGGSAGIGTQSSAMHFPIVQDLEVVVGNNPGLAAGLVIGNMIFAMSGPALGNGAPNQGNSSAVFTSGPTCPLAPIQLFAYMAGTPGSWFIVRKIAFWDAMNTYGCECPIAAAGGRPVIIGFSGGIPSATVPIGTTYTIVTMFDAPGTPAGVTSGVLQVGSLPVALPLVAGISGGGTKVCDVLNNFYDPSAGGFLLTFDGVPGPVSLPIPLDSSLIGQALYFQWVTTAGGELASSPGAHVTITP